MQKQIILFIIILFMSCNNSLPIGNGANNQVTIFVSNEDREIIDLYLAPLFNNTILKSDYELLIKPFQYLLKEEQQPKLKKQKMLI